MIMISILYVLGHGGVLKNVSPLSLHYYLVWLLEVFSYCAVDVFAMISGYVGYGKTFNYSNIIYYSLQVMFYTITITSLVFLTKPSIINIKEILKAFFPFIYDVYWYFTAYFCLMFFIPLINLLTKRIDRKEFNILLILCFLLFSLLPTLFHADPAITKQGFSFLWIAVLYIVGSYVKKYSLDAIISTKIALKGFIMCCIITYLSKIVIDFITLLMFGKSRFGNFLLSYISPLIILAAVFLVLGFANMKVGNNTKKFLSIFAPASFGVYLFHEEPLIRKLLITNKFSFVLDYNPLISCSLVLILALSIWLTGSLIDIIRQYIFVFFNIKQYSISVTTCLLDKFNILTKIMHCNIRL